MCQYTLFLIRQSVLWSNTCQKDIWRVAYQVYRNIHINLQVCRSTPNLWTYPNIRLRPPPRRIDKGGQTNGGCGNGGENSVSEGEIGRGFTHSSSLLANNRRRIPILRSGAPTCQGYSALQLCWDSPLPFPRAASILRSLPAKTKVSLSFTHTHTNLQQRPSFSVSSQLCVLL
jgi:hypothetical protein